MNYRWLHRTLASHRHSDDDNVDISIINLLSILEAEDIFIFNNTKNNEEQPTRESTNPFQMQLCVQKIKKTIL